MAIAILDPFSGISGDMTLGALIDVGLDRAWLEQLPASLGLGDVRVQVRDVKRGDIACKKVDFEIPPQPHGRHIKAIRRIVAESGAPPEVREKADEAFTAIATCEAEIHGTSVEAVHLHEVGAVDAILDVLGSIWGLHLLGVRDVYCETVALGDGSVRAAHGLLPVPAPATLKLLEGIRVRPGPEASGELVTPTGAALLRVLAAGRRPPEYVPTRSGFGAGTKEFEGRANALRIVLGEHVESTPTGDARTLTMLASDIDDMSPEYIAAAAEEIRVAGALDVALLSIIMKKGRPGTRVEVLCEPSDAPRIEHLLLTSTTTIGVRRTAVQRRALVRSKHTVSVQGQPIGVKLVTRPDGTRTFKPEHEDVARVAQTTGSPWQAIFKAAEEAAERSSAEWV